MLIIYLGWIAGRHEIWTRVREGTAIPWPWKIRVVKIKQCGLAEFLVLCINAVKKKKSTWTMWGDVALYVDGVGESHRRVSCFVICRCLWKIKQQKAMKKCLAWARLLQCTISLVGSKGIFSDGKFIPKILKQLIWNGLTSFGLNQPLCAAFYKKARYKWQKSPGAKCWGGVAGYLKWTRHGRSG